MDNKANEISEHQVRAYLFLKSARGWVTAGQLADGAKIAPRTARHFAKLFVDLGIADLAEVFPGHRYRLSAKASKRNASYIKRIEGAASVFGSDKEK